jgi:hypothetical protein
LSKHDLDKQLKVRFHSNNRPNYLVIFIYGGTQKNRKLENCIDFCKLNNEEGSISFPFIEKIMDAMAWNLLLSRWILKFSSYYDNL